MLDTRIKEMVVAYSNLIESYGGPTEFAKQGAYSTPYWGTQQITSYPQVVTQLVEIAPQYVDLTAGGGRYPVHRAQQGQRVACNDRCVYAAVSLDAVLCSKTTHTLGFEEWLEAFAQATHPIYVASRKGWLHRRAAKGDVLEGFEATASYIDGLVSQFERDSLVLAAVGATLVEDCSHNGLSWLQDVSSVTTDVFWRSFVREAVRIRCTIDSMPMHGYVHQVTNMDALESLDNLHIEGGAVCYIDPAWPWMSTDGANPYTFFSTQISAVLAQSDLQVPFWSRHEPEAVYAEIGTWINRAFEKGAAYFIVSTQGTNSPPPNDLYDWLGTEFDLTHVENVVAKSSRTGKEFVEWYGIVKAS